MGKRPHESDAEYDARRARKKARKAERKALEAKAERKRLKKERKAAKKAKKKEAAPATATIAEDATAAEKVVLAASVPNMHKPLPPIV